MPGHARTGGRDVIFAWEQCKLSDISEKSYEKNTDNKYSTVLTNSAEYGIVKQRDFFDKDIANSSNISGYYVVRKNYFVYNPRISNQAKFGPINRNKLDESGIMSPLYLVFTVHDIDESFLETLFQTTTWHRFMYQNGDTGARADRFAIKDSTFMSMPIKVPSLEEQHKLALAFQKLDQTITLHEEKKRQLERLKSALLQKMFADKSGYPPVRFEGFSDKWEQVKYGEIFQRRSKMGVSTPTLPSVEYDDINPGMGTLNKEPKSKGISKRGIYFNPGDVLFGKLRPYLKNWLFACFEGVAVGDFWVLTSSKIDHGFTYSLIQTPGFQYIANLSSGSKMPRSDWGLVSNARTFIPINHLEQERISSVLFGLDHAITLYEHKLEILNKIKSFLLQNMFI
ncbi:restriction endonuclease subunit S [Lactobacillus delbrueckii subsp. bulgaricus]|uniref:restriction endonuclease subunit S n=1 Tax=Lactobacillus delbrueckii TaxID=1584 RepID=UPI0020581580|nr:restriction endonuclease subunit S [Lactobacillus delbrueckii subsp. bulgaricus]